MNKLWLLALILIPVASANSDDAAPAGFERWSASTLESMTRTLATQAASDPHHLAFKQVADYPNDAFLLAHREADGAPELHETQVDAIFVVSGSAMLIFGGTLLNAQTVSPHEKRNGTIQGGARQKLSAGDIVRIPPNTPHQLVLDGAREFTYFVVKVKGY